MIKYVLVLFNAKESLIATIDFERSHPLQIGEELIIPGSPNKCTHLRVEGIVSNTISQEILISCGMLTGIIDGEHDGSCAVWPFGAMIVSMIQDSEFWKLGNSSPADALITAPRVTFNPEEIESSRRSKRPPPAST